MLLIMAEVLFLQLIFGIRCKFPPFIRIMAELFTEFGAWRNFLKPVINSRLFFGDSRWPETLHKNPGAVLWRNWQVDAFDPDISHGDHPSNWMSNASELKHTELRIFYFFESAPQQCLYFRPELQGHGALRGGVVRSAKLGLPERRIFIISAAGRPL